MPTVTICSFNVEWMSDWFTPDAKDAAFRPQFARDGEPNDTARTAKRLRDTIRASAPAIAAFM